MNEKQLVHYDTIFQCEDCDSVFENPLRALQPHDDCVLPRVARRKWFRP